MQFTVLSHSYLANIGSMKNGSFVFIFINFVNRMDLLSLLSGQCHIVWLVYSLYP